MSNFNLNTTFKIFVLEPDEIQQYDYKEANRTSQIPRKQLAKVVYNDLIMQK